jgi:16S rRNA processing protein RimM
LGAAPGRHGRVAVGRIRKAFGIRGEVLLEPTGEDPDRFTPGVTLFLGETGPEAVIIAQARLSEGAWFLQFVGRPDRNSVEPLAGLWVYRDASELPPLKEGEYYHFQLVGLRVTRADGSALGTLESVRTGAGADLYEVQGPAGEWLIPGCKEFVEWVDLEKGEMRLTNRDDLLAAQEETDPARRRDRSSESRS